MSQSIGSVDGCLNCAHYHSYIEFHSGKSIRTCKAGHIADMEQWWLENGNKMRSNGDIITGMPCFEQTEQCARLDRMIKLVDEMREMLSKPKEK